MAGQYILALDQGTTSSRAILFDHHARPVAVGQREFPQIYPRAGWVEHDPEQIWASQWGAVQDCLAAAHKTGEDIAAIGITNQRETTVLWDRSTGRALGNAIVWQCRRTAGRCDELKAQGLEPLFRERTGLVVDAYFSGTKVAWMLDNTAGARARAENGEIAFGTVDSWLIHKLTGGRRHVTDVSNASRTLMYNIHTLDWDDELLGALDVPRAVCPEVVDSSGVAGETDPSWFGRPIPIAGIAGDQQAALFGQACLEPGMAKNTYGTGSFVLMNTGSEPVASRHGLVTTVAWRIAGKTTYALEGSIFVTGAVVQWLRDGLGIIGRAEETEGLALSVSDTDGVYLVPAFVGLGAPYWDSYARGTLVGITRGTGRGHVVRAALESIAFQSRDVLDAMAKDSGRELETLRVDGGAIANQFLAQFQADILGATVERPEVTETTALGSAFLAGLAVGYWPDESVIQSTWSRDALFTPSMAEEERSQRYTRWQAAVERSRAWVAPE
ncbi:MAG: glycerol kinase GlpK [Thermaerobacter sp.]|nr:glycerol kinase GlpK [Thermaerobacter sp.]